MGLLKEHQIVIFDDEIQAFGRTPQLFAFQYFGLEKYIDIATIGKLSQVCATLFTADMNPRPGLLSQTFTGSTSAIRASIAILKHLIQGDFYGPDGKIARIHRYFVDKLEEIAKRLPHAIRGPYGVGGMIAFTPFDGELPTAMKFVRDLFDNGVMSFVAGTNPTRVRFLMPAGVVTLEDIDNVARLIEMTLSKS
jgi:4-aminobutyrate aminotransferase-like enzyme